MVITFPIERIGDRAIVAALMPAVEEAIRLNPKASAAEIADAALRLLDPDDRSGPLIREGCRASLEQIARDILLAGPS